MESRSKSVVVLENIEGVPKLIIQDLHVINRKIEEILNVRFVQKICACCFQQHLKIAHKKISVRAKNVSNYTIVVHSASSTISTRMTNLSYMCMNQQGLSQKS